MKRLRTVGTVLSTAAVVWALALGHGTAAAEWAIVLALLVCNAVEHP